MGRHWVHRNGQDRRGGGAVADEAIEVHVAGLREDGEPVPETACVVAYLEVQA